MEPKVPQVTKPVVLDTSGVPQGTKARNTDRVCAQQGKPREGEPREGEQSSSKHQHTSSSSESSGSFVVSIAPKAEDAISSERNKEKPRRGSELRGKQTATRLVRGTLAPVPSVRNIVKLLDNDYSYEEAHRLLPTLTIQDAPMTKKAIAGIYTADECTTDVRFVFPRQFVQKAKTAILEFRKALVVVCADDSVGVRVSRFGIFMLKDTDALNQWHTCMEYLSQTEDAINWTVNTSVKRITIPDQLSDGISSSPK
ncbi:hypothetical protein PC121_g8490 [Phytophthora cactorum]|nr:hypothetical protein PC120_g24252 [Phytophthora cactorum]KAG3073868.1 hypothetical protein PC121_g8490 [Phytophthora cactorum]KAG4039607.1 hypothetical protein PC123_g24847 [Phytophthora cactorum]